MLKSKYCLLVIIILSNFVFGQTSQWEILWDQNTENDMYQYWIYRGTSPDPTVLHVAVDHPAISYEDNQLTRGVLYYYRVTAVDFFLNESGYSANVSAAIPKIDFSSLPAQHISPGETITINNLDNYITDPDDNSHIWAAGSSSLTVTFNNQSVEIIAPANLTSNQIVEFTATDPDGFSDAASITFVADNVQNDPPSVANAIADITVEENAANTVIDLSNVFTDPDDDDSAITKAVQNNSNPTLLTPTITNGNTLTLDYQPNQSGTADITIRATSAGLFVDDVFQVTVHSASNPPTVANPITDITVNENAANTVIDLSNVFTDPDNDDSAIIKSVQNISNPALLSATISAGNTLTLDYQPNQNGTANITIRGTSAGQFVDDIFLVTVTAIDDTSSPADDHFAYPVPLNLAENPNAKISFQNVPDNATVLIYNMLGELVHKIENVPYEWDVKNEAGKAIYPGVYLYYIKSGGKKRTGKLVIVK